MTHHRKLVLSALFAASGVILPLILHQFGNISGQMFLPLHLPVLAAGLILGPIEGVLVAVISVGLSFTITAMPPAAMLPFVATETIIYGIISGLFQKFCQKGLPQIYVSLITTQILGRFVYAAILFIINMNAAIVLTALTTSLIGIIAQIAIVPLIVKGCQKNDRTS